MTANRDANDATLLVVEDLRTHFATPAGTLKAVDGVSLTVESGQTLGIVGESGSGKTVLARSIMGLNVASNATTTGSVRFKGRELVGLHPRHMKELWGAEMAMVFQDPMTSVNPVVRIGRQVTEHLRAHRGVAKDAARRMGIELLRSVRIPEPEQRFDSYPHELSGGTRQRVCIAMALACKPDLILADEPTTALDVTVQHQILNLLAAQQRNLGLAMVLVTHDLGVVAGRSDTVAVMYAGKFVERAATAELFTDMRHPYTEALMRSIPVTTNPKHTRLAAISGRPPNLVNPSAGCKFAPRCPYVHDRCRSEEPSLDSTPGSDHVYACHAPVGSPRAEIAYRDNLDAGLPQTLAVQGRLPATEEPIPVVIE